MLSIIISAFFLGFVATIAATGPVTFLVLKEALMGKYKKSIGLMIGSVTMETIYCGFALTTVGILLQYAEKLKTISQIISILVFLVIGVSLLVMKIENRIQKKGEKLSKIEHAKSFLTGFILVAMNPTIILTWAAASAALISLGIITISAFQQVIAFILSAALGSIAGGLTMILLVKKFRVKLSEKFIKKTLRILGAVIITIALYFIFQLLNRLSQG